MVPHTFAVSAAVELAVVERDGFVESRHAGSAVMLAPDATTLGRWGDPDAPVLPRSTLKPLQALACVTAGAPLDGEALAVAMASHAGTERHVAVVRRILELGGFGEDALRCPPAWPADRVTRLAMIREGRSAAPVRMECSGKHAAMVLACRSAGWDPDSYWEPRHPLQVHIRDVVERMAGERATATAVDGCGAPVHALTLTGLARAIHRMGAASPVSPFALHRHSAAVVAAARAEPWAVEGPGRTDTIVAERTGVLCKTGAEGMVVMLAPDGTTVAVKILDGAARAAAVVALRLLESAGAVTPDSAAAAAAGLPVRVMGAGVPVGAVLPSPDLLRTAARA